MCNALRILGNVDNYPIYIHCSHGKDRTGLICALALWVAGVGLNAICDDYHLSEAYGQTDEVSKATILPAFDNLLERGGGGRLQQCSLI